MKHDCDIVRDLMPMCIDGTASEKTCQMVDEHVQECPPCDAVYKEMQADARLDVPVQPQRAEFTQTVKRMNKYRKQRKLLMVFAGVLATVFLSVLAYGVYWQFFELVPVAPEYITLYTTLEGEAQLRLVGVPENVRLHIEVTQSRWYAGGEHDMEARLHVYSCRNDRGKRETDYEYPLGMTTDTGVMMQVGPREIEVARVSYADQAGIIYLQCVDNLEWAFEVRERQPDQIDLVNISSYVVYDPSEDAPSLGFITPTPKPETSPAP